MKHNNIIDFYKDVVLSLGLNVTDDGFVKIDVGNGKLSPLTIKGKPLVLPLKEHIDTVLEPKENGELETTKILYNPLNEDVIKLDSISLRKTKEIIDKKLAHSVAGLGELLLKLASNPELQKKTSLEINKFLSSLKEADNPGIHDVVDPKSVNTWTKLYAKSIESPVNEKIIKIFLKKAGTHLGIKYNRLCTLSLPLYEKLLKATRETHVNGYQLRKKDIVVYRLIFEFIFQDLDDNHLMVIGSNDPESPGFIALLTTFIKVATRINRIVKYLKNIDEASYDFIKFDLRINLKELSELDKFKSELNTIPGELSLNRMKAKPAVATQVSNIGGIALPIADKQPPIVTQSEVVKPTDVQPPELTLEQKILYGNNIPVVQTQQPMQQVTQQQVYPMQQVAQPQQMMPPMGINSIRPMPQYQPMGQYPQMPQYQQMPAQQQYMQPAQYAGVQQSLMQQAMPQQMPQQYGQPMATQQYGMPRANANPYMH